MRFPNALAGVKKLFTAEILQIITAVLAIIAAIAALFSLGAAMAGSGEGALVGIGGAAVAVLVAGVIGIIALVLKLLGLFQAGKDEPTYLKTAFYFAIAELVASVLSSVFQANSAGTICGSLSRVCGIVVTFYVITGIRVLAEQLHRDDMVSFGNKVIWIVAIAYALSALMNLFPTAAAGVLGIIAAALLIIGTIVFIIYLAKAKKMLTA